MTIFGALGSALVLYIVADIAWPGAGPWVGGGVLVLAVLGWVASASEWLLKVVRGATPPVTIEAGTGTRTPRSGRKMPPPQGVRVLIRYRDRNGRRSERTISAQQIKGDVNTNGTLILHTIEAYCFDRQNFRTFLVSRIEEAANPDTGELIRDFPTFIARAFGQQHEIVRAGLPQSEGALPE